MKLSVRLINHLNRKGTFNDFLSEYNTIHEKDPAYANTFAGMLEIAKGLGELGQDYLIIGGLAVASYLHQMDDKAFQNWRGTSDIDLLVPDRNVAEKILLYSDYHFKQVQHSKEGMIGNLYDYVKQDNGEPTVVGLRMGLCDKSKRDITRKLLIHQAIIPVHGVGVAVPRIRDLIEMKRWANRSKDRSDIKTLKSMFLLGEN
jgi:predicted nucleotidyltransferase